MFFAGSVGVILTACRQVGVSAVAAAVADTIHNQSENNQKESDTETYILPSPMQIGVIFRRAGLSYQPGLTNQSSDIARYDSKYAQALNVGIYGADLTYCVLNKQTGDALTYLKTIRSLADKLGFGSVFDVDNMSKRFESNLNSQDSLTEITSDLQLETDTYLNENQEKYIGAISFAGAWIESMYIGSKVFATRANEKISDRISEQMTILDNLVKCLNLYVGKESHISELVGSLKDVENSYTTFPEIKAAGESEQNPKLTDEHIAQLGKEIENLRQKFIS